MVMQKNILFNTKKLHYIRCKDLRYFFTIEVVGIIHWRCWCDGDEQSDLLGSLSFCFWGFFFFVFPHFPGWTMWAVIVWRTPPVSARGGMISFHDWYVTFEKVWSGFESLTIMGFCKLFLSLYHFVFLRVSHFCLCFFCWNLTFCCVNEILKTRNPAHG